MRIADTQIGAGAPPFIIAELSANHNGSIDRALETIDAAKKAGASAIKLQTYTADTMTIDHDSDDFLIAKGPWKGRRLYELYQEAHTPWEWHPALFARARELDLPVFSTPFDPTAIDLLMTLDTPALKVASFELTDLPLLRAMAATAKPMIISTGLANLGEIERAVDTVRAAGNENFVLLHCVSAYPAPVEDINLTTIPLLADIFGVPVGLSDHTLGTTVAVAAVALGACVIEKHFTLARADGGPDSAFSLEPDEFARLVEDCHTAWKARGRPHVSPTGSEAASIVFRRSLYVVADVAAGETITHENVRSIRPGYGLSPASADEVFGKVARHALRRGKPLEWGDIG